MSVRRASMPLSLLARSLLALSLIVTLAPTSAYAQGAPAGAKKGSPGAKDSDEASARFRSGVEFYKKRDFTAALVEFKKAYELAPNYRVLFNLGQTSRELDDYATALQAFEQYLEEGGKEVPPVRIRDVRGWIEELKKKVGRVTVETNVEGAEVLVDDVPMGETPLTDPIVVNVGRHKFTATLTGYTQVQRVIDVSGMEESTLTLELVKIERRQDKPDPTPPPPPPPEAKTPVAAWVMLSVTGAAAIVTGVMGGLALSAKSDLDDQLDTFPGDPTAIQDAQSRTNSFAIGTDVAGAIAIAGAVTTVILFVVPIGSGEGSEVTEGEAQGEGDASANVYVSPMGVGVWGRF